MLSLLKKTASVCLTLLGQRKFLFFLGVLFSMVMGYGQVTIDFSQASGSDDENIGGNLPVLLVDGEVFVAATVTVTDLLTGTATSGVDYNYTSPQVVDIPIGLYDGTIATAIPIPTLSIIDDIDVEVDETIDFSLGLPTGDAILGTQTATTYTIVNDDDVTVEFSQAIGSDDENVGGNLPVLLVSGDVVVATTVTVTNLLTGTATSGVDYDYTSPQVVDIPIGSYDGTIGTAVAIPTLSIIGDTQVEVDETIDLSLGSPTGDAILGTQTATTYTITNDDVNPPSGYGVTIDQSLITDANETAVSFTFSGAEVNADYNYTFTSDGGGTPVVGSGTIANADQQIVGIDVSGLADGVITLSVTLTNSGGIGSPVTDTADKDTAAPAGYSVTINQVAIDANNEDAITFTINSAQLFSTYSYTFTSSGGGTPITGNGGPILSTNPTIPLLGGIDLGGLPDGTIQLSVVLSDLFGSGNPATDSVIKDTAVPSGYGVSINQDPIDETNETAVSFAFTGAEVGADYEYTFSSDGGGLPVSGTGSINSVNQQLTGINLSGLGNGTITLSVTLSNINGTGNAATDTVTKNTCFSGTMAPTLDNSVPTAICNSFSQDLDDYVSNTPPTGSVLQWSSNPNTAVTEDYLGSSTVSATGTYYGFFYDAVNDCASNVLQITITDCSNVCPTAPSAPPLDASEPTVFCDVINVDLNDYLTSTAAPPGTILTWSVDSDPLETDAHLNISNVMAPGSYYGFFYDESNGCASPILQITLVRNYTPVIEETVGDAVCATGTATLSATATVEDDSTITYNWFAAPTGGTSLGTGNSFVTPSITETTSFYVSASANGCVSERVEVVATVNETPLAGVPLEDISVCNVTSDEGPNTLDLDETLIGQDAGTWTVVTDPSNGTLAIGADNTVNFISLPSGDYVFEYTTNVAVAPCENATVQVTVSVLDCVSNEAIDLAVTKELKDEIAYLLGDPITFVITLENVEGKTVTDIVVSDVLDDAFQHEGHQATLGEYDPATGEWTISNMAATDATATLEITVISTTAGTLQNTATLVSSFPNDDVASNNTATVSVQVNRSQCEDPGTICNIFSPNGDGVNDLLTLVDHTAYPNNTFEVFDRYGNSVFQMDRYDSSWDGTGKNGDLPKGTYFYILDLGDGSEVVKGWIQIVRNN